MKDIKVKIGGYEWTVKFVDKGFINGCDGRTHCNEFVICIREDLQPVVMRETIVHEIVHALLTTQGRYYQKKFDLEEVCEFVGWQLPEIYGAATSVFKAMEAEQAVEKSQCID